MWLERTLTPTDPGCRSWYWRWESWTFILWGLAGKVLHNKDPFLLVENLYVSRGPRRTRPCWHKWVAVTCYRFHNSSTPPTWQGSELFSVRTEATSPLLSTTKRDNWALLSALVFLSVTWWGCVGSCPVYIIIITCAQRLEDPRLSYAGGLRCVLTKEYWEQVSNVSSLRTVYTVRPDWLQLSTTLYYSSRDSCS